MAYTDLSGDIVQYAQEKGAYLVQVSPLWVHLPETMLTALHLLKEVISDFA